MWTRLHVRGLIWEHVELHRRKLCSAGGAHLLKQLLCCRCIFLVQHVHALFQPQPGTAGPGPCVTVSVSLHVISFTLKYVLTDWTPQVVKIWQINPSFHHISAPPKLSFYIVKPPPNPSLCFTLKRLSCCICLPAVVFGTLLSSTLDRALRLVPNQTVIIYDIKWLEAASIGDFLIRF